MEGQRRNFMLMPDNPPSMTPPTERDEPPSTDALSRDSVAPEVERAQARRALPLLLGMLCLFGLVLGAVQLLPLANQWELTTLLTMASTMTGVLLLMAWRELRRPPGGKGRPRTSQGFRPGRRSTGTAPAARADTVRRRGMLRRAFVHPRVNLEI
jgi:hypothetical protein